jgi:hypothetical protein
MSGSGQIITYAPVINFGGGLDDGRMRAYSQQLRKQWEADMPGLIKRHSKDGKI